MSLESAAEFFSEMIQGEGILEMSRVATEGRDGPQRADALVTLAAKRGFDFTADEVREAHRLLISLTELSDDDLDQVTGGVSGETERTQNQSAATAFQGFDQRSSQLYNLLGSVLRAKKDMTLGAIGNML